MGNDQAAPDTRNWSEDLKKVQAIVQGDSEAWKWFIDQYSNRIFATAHSWSTIGQKHQTQLTRITRLLRRLADREYDEVMEAYTFIVAQLRKKILPAYRGECSLSTYMFTLFNPLPQGSGAPMGARLKADYVRWVTGERLRLPEAVKRLTRVDQQVYELLWKGRDVPAVAAELGEELESVQESDARIQEVLGWKKYEEMLGRRRIHEVSLSEWKLGDTEDEEQEFDPPDSSPGTETKMRLGQSTEALRVAFNQLPEIERSMLRLMFAERLTAAQAGPRLGITPRQVYYLYNNALTHLATALKSLTPGPVGRDLDLLEKALGELSGWHDSQERSPQ